MGHVGKTHGHRHASARLQAAVVVDVTAKTNAQISHRLLEHKNSIMPVSPCFKLDSILEILKRHCDSNGFTATEVYRDGPWDSGTSSILIDIGLKDPGKFFYEQMRVSPGYEYYLSHVSIDRSSETFTSLEGLVGIVDNYLKEKCKYHPRYGEARPKPPPPRLTKEQISTFVTAYVKRKGATEINTYGSLIGWGNPRNGCLPHPKNTVQISIHFALEGFLYDIDISYARPFTVKFSQIDEAPFTCLKHLRTKLDDAFARNFGYAKLSTRPPSRT